VICRAWNVSDSDGSKKQASANDERLVVQFNAAARSFAEIEIVSVGSSQEETFGPNRSARGDDGFAQEMFHHPAM